MEAGGEAGVIQADDMAELVGKRALEVLGVAVKLLGMAHVVAPGEVGGIEFQVGVQDLAGVLSWKTVVMARALGS